MFFHSGNKPPPGEVTVQCPRCGGERARTTISSRDRQTGKEVPQHNVLSSQAAAGILIVVGVLVALMSSAVLGPDLGLGSGLVGCLFGAGALFAVVYFLTRREVAAVRVYHYHCTRCGNDWDWQEGKPVPVYRPHNQIQEDYEAVFGSGRNDNTENG
jgi:hypothetical protein